MAIRWITLAAVSLLAVLGAAPVLAHGSETSSRLVASVELIGSKHHGYGHHNRGKGRGFYRDYGSYGRHGFSYGKKWSYGSRYFDGHKHRGHGYGGYGNGGPVYGYRGGHDFYMVKPRHHYRGGDHKGAIILGPHGIRLPGITLRY